jgi:hypothetical protein
MQERVMSEKIDNLILEHLKLFQGSLNRLEKEVSEVKSRLTNLEIGQGEILSMVGHQNSLVAQKQVKIDEIENRILKIEKRLELI